MVKSWVSQQLLLRERQSIAGASFSTEREIGRAEKKSRRESSKGIILFILNLMTDRQGRVGDQVEIRRGNQM